MNATGVWLQAIRLAGVPADRISAARAAADRWLEPYLRRDSTVHDGKGLGDVVDQETLEHSLKEVQLRAPGPVKPFVFGPAEIKSLANHIKRELRLN